MPSVTDDVHAHNENFLEDTPSMFAVVGESLMDLMTEADGRLLPVPGGGPYNFARALALQQVPTAYLNPFSSDLFGDELARTLATSGAVHLGRRSRLPTSLAVVTRGADGQPRYSFYRADVADRDLDIAALLAALPPGAVGVHSGALALVPPDDLLIAQLLHAAHARGMLCTVDLNMRPFVAQSMGVSSQRYRDAALDAARLAHVVKVSDEDLAALGLVGEPQVAARALLEGACRLVVLTRGAHGAWAIGESGATFVPSLPVKVVDTVGAGDCFFAGFLAAIHAAQLVDALRQGGPPPDALNEALCHATRCAALSVQRTGCVPPTWGETRRLGEPARSG